MIATELTWSFAWGWNIQNCMGRGSKHCLRAQVQGMGWHIYDYCNLTARSAAMSHIALMASALSCLISPRANL